MNLPPEKDGELTKILQRPFGVTAIEARRAPVKELLLEHAHAVGVGHRGELDRHGAEGCAGLVERR